MCYVVDADEEFSGFLLSWCVLVFIALDTLLSVPQGCCVPATRSVATNSVGENPTQIQDWCNGSTAGFEPAGRGSEP